ncbi:MFS transporter [Pelotomaculum propionicicum]|uniref:Bacillibactin exporter n=1 Tax=Pelotomaculum propionicicum TaxID=258475 RepID=A0A4Y7RKK1_9FIRM|nr:MFS transporter [Pelotomaculum propionicicum]NLI11500.1 MFS transporter [Peptococcaceae bacterium]TEB08847.1 Bacillibactin exporter [Pelotomaculum propionicicum]
MQDHTQTSRQAAGLKHSVSIWTRNFTLLCLANLTLFISLQMLLPTLPLYLLEIGGSQRDVGYVMGVYTTGAMAMRPFAGWLVDRYGRRKIVVLGLVMLLAVAAFYRLAAGVSLIIFLRCLHGMAFGIVGTAMGTMVVDSLPTSRLGEGMGYFGLTSSLSMALAPLLGFWLVGKSGYPVLFLAVFLLSLLTFCCSLPVRDTNVPVIAPGGSAAGIWASLLEKTALPASWVMFFLAAVYGSVLSFISLYATERGIANIGLFFTAIALTMLVSRPVSGRWTDRGGSNMILLIGHLTILIAMISLSLSRTSTGFLLAGAVLGLGFGACIPTLQALSVRHTPEHRRGAATGTFFIAFDLGIGLGTILWGYVAEATGYQVMYLTTLLPLALAGAIYYRSRDSKKHT